MKYESTLSKKLHSFAAGKMIGKGLFGRIAKSKSTELMKTDVVIISSVDNNWGGSEELWYETALALLQRNISVTIYKRQNGSPHEKLIRLRSLGAQVYNHYEKPMVKMLKLGNFVAKLFRGKNAQNRDSAIKSFWWYKDRIYDLWNIYDQIAFVYLERCIRKNKPRIVVLNQGDNNDGYPYFELLKKLNVAYISISHKASGLIWPSNEVFKGLREGYQKAIWNYFVSQHNLNLTAMQLGISMSNASVIRNPVAFQPEQALKWPKDEDILHLACVGRLWTMDKGQDLLLQVLAKAKWRKRPLKVSIYGEGPDELSLKAMKNFLNLSQVAFRGFTRNVEALWQSHHALILPSRAEGQPLVVTEAMLCGRPVIALPAGGTGEIVEDGKSGFIGDGPSVEALDKVLERAWKERNQWEQMGKEAFRAAQLFLEGHDHNLANEISKWLEMLRKESYSAHNNFGM